jgi:hypothetical protein
LPLTCRTDGRRWSQSQGRRGKRRPPHVRSGPPRCRGGPCGSPAWCAGGRRTSHPGGIHTATTRTHCTVGSRPCIHACDNGVSISILSVARHTCGRRVRGRYDVASWGPVGTVGSCAHQARTGSHSHARWHGMRSTRHAAQSERMGHSSDGRCGQRARHCGDVSSCSSSAAEATAVGIGNAVGAGVAARRGHQGRSVLVVFSWRRDGGGDCSTWIVEGCCACDGMAADVARASTSNFIVSFMMRPTCVCCGMQNSV